ncbi:hypothetical protein T492DRAFT_1027659 [Pavlovales sp. CCMP2436]|nr:hypothetical protein T492DRAFT_1027659 [Pavlovales sp. CCMP2436]
MAPPAREAQADPARAEWTPEEHQRISDALAIKLPSEAIATRAGQGGKHFSYIEFWKVIERTNQIFGFDGWSSTIMDMAQEYLDFKDGRTSVGYTVLMRVTLKNGAFHEDVGFGSMEKQTDRGKAIENAKKEAVSDATKRALKSFGHALGLSIYDAQHCQEVKVQQVARADAQKRARLSGPSGSEITQRPLAERNGLPAATKPHGNGITWADGEGAPAGGLQAEGQVRAGGGMGGGQPSRHVPPEFGAQGGAGMGAATACPGVGPQAAGAMYRCQANGGAGAQLGQTEGQHWQQAPQFAHSLQQQQQPPAQQQMLLKQQRAQPHMQPVWAGGGGHACQALQSGFSPPSDSTLGGAGFRPGPAGWGLGAAQGPGQPVQQQLQQPQQQLQLQPQQQPPPQQQLSPPQQQQQLGGFARQPQRAAPPQAPPPNGCVGPSATMPTGMIALAQQPQPNPPRAMQGAGSGPGLQDGQAPQQSSASG